MRLIYVCSPVDVPFVEEEPLLSLGQVHVNVLIDASDDENLVIVANGLSAEELLRLPQRALHALNLANLRVQREAVRDPTVVAAEDHDFRVVEREAAHSVAS